MAAGGTGAVGEPDRGRIECALYDEAIVDVLLLDFRTLAESVWLQWADCLCFPERLQLRLELQLQ